MRFILISVMDSDTYGRDGFLLDLQFRCLGLRLRVYRWVQSVAPVDRWSNGVPCLEAFDGMIQPRLLSRVIIEPGQGLLVLQESTFVFPGCQDRSFQYWSGNRRTVHLVVARGRSRLGPL